MSRVFYLSSPRPLPAYPADIFLVLRSVLEEGAQLDLRPQLKHHSCFRAPSALEGAPLAWENSLEEKKKKCNSEVSPCLALGHATRSQKTVGFKMCVCALKAHTYMHTLHR